MTSIDAIIDQIRAAQSARRNAMKAQMRINSQTLGAVRSAMHWHSAEEDEREKLKAASVSLVKAIEKGQPTDAGEWVVGSVHAAANARKPFDDLRAAAEKQMEKLAKQLPAWEFVQGVRGFGALGLAIIVGECGNLADYANPAKLWKRMGVGVINGKAQGHPGEGASAADWIEHGYNCVRRSALFTIADSLLKNNDGKYRQLYLERKRVEFAKAQAEGLIAVTSNKTTADNWLAAGLPQLTVVKKIDRTKHRDAGHIDKRARRYVEKALLKNLWQAWRAKTPGLVTVDVG